MLPLCHDSLFILAVCFGNGTIAVSKIEKENSFFSVATKLFCWEYGADGSIGLLMVLVAEEWCYDSAEDSGNADNPVNKLGLMDDPMDDLAMSNYPMNAVWYFKLLSGKTPSGRFKRNCPMLSVFCHALLPKETFQSWDLRVETDYIHLLKGKQNTSLALRSRYLFCNSVLSITQFVQV